MTRAIITIGLLGVAFVGFEALMFMRHAGVLNDDRYADGISAVLLVVLIAVYVAVSR